jgi:L-ascorbate metabolism protein UlaG (beta-lactamase superfamily)
MKKPVRQDEAFLTEVRGVRGEGQEDRLDVWWLGQSGFLLMWQGRSLLLDPYLSDSLTRKYATTDKPHVRMTERVVDPGCLEGIEAVTSSHAHTDHLDPETLTALVRTQPGLVMVCPESIRTLAQERSGLPEGSVLGLDARLPGREGRIEKETVTLGDGTWRLTAVPAAHEGLDVDGEGRLLHLGYVVEVGPFRVYHSGDTLLYEGLVERLRGEAIHLAMLPINGRAPERRVAGNLSGAEAARLAWEARVMEVVPCHYDLFEFNTATPEAFVRHCEELGQPYRVMEQGGRHTVEAL